MEAPVLILAIVVISGVVGWRLKSISSRDKIDALNERLKFAQDKEGVFKNEFGGLVQKFSALEARLESMSSSLPEITDTGAALESLATAGNELSGVLYVSPNVNRYPYPSGGDT